MATNEKISSPCNFNHREPQRTTENHRETQRTTEEHRETQRNTEIFCNKMIIKQLNQIRTVTLCVSLRYSVVDHQRSYFLTGTKWKASSPNNSKLRKR